VARKRLLECSFLIPVRRDRNLSDGRAHSTRAWAWLADGLTAFGGATRDTGLYEGWYVDPDTGERVKDRSGPYVVAVPREGVGRLRTLLAEACTVFRQQCICLSVAGSVEFVEGPSRAAD
jgi:hypothetical protein